MTDLPALIVAALLYRWPRGTGLPFPKGGELVWALGTSSLLYAATLDPWGWAFAPLLFAGEAPGWSRWWPNNETIEPRYWVRMAKLSARGCLVFNPLMGPIDFAMHELGPRLKGDIRAYGELMSGAVTVTVCYSILGV